MSITLKEIYESSTGLLIRFHLMPSPKTAHLKMSEELYEMDEALFELGDNRKNIILRSDAADECADVLITLLNTIYANQLTCDDLERALERVMLKNGLKSEATHHVVNGMIVKRLIPQESES